MHLVDGVRQRGFKGRVVRLPHGAQLIAGQGEIAPRSQRGDVHLAQRVQIHALQPGAQIAQAVELGVQILHDLGHHVGIRALVARLHRRRGGLAQRVGGHRVQHVLGGQNLNRRGRSHLNVVLLRRDSAEQKAQQRDVGGQTDQRDLHDRAELCAAGAYLLFHGHSPHCFARKKTNFSGEYRTNERLAGEWIFRPMQTQISKVCWM